MRRLRYRWSEFVGGEEGFIVCRVEESRRGVIVEGLVLQNDIQSVDDSRNVSKDGEEDYD